VAEELSKIIRRSFAEPERATVQEAVASRVEANPESFLARFRALPQSLDGRFVSADLMKETIAEYSESKVSRGWLNAAVHNSAAVLAAEQLRRVLAEPKEEARPAVLIATGIPGAGKTSLVLGIGHLPRVAHAVYEGQMADPKVAVEKVKQVLDAGFTPLILVVHTPPERALDNTLERYENLGRGAGIGLMATIQSGLPNGLRVAHAAFGDRVALQIVDRRNFNEPILLKGWEHLGILETEGTHEQIKQRLAAHLEVRRPQLSDGAYRQAAGLSPERPAQRPRPRSAGEREAPGDGPRPPPQDSEAARLALRPERARAFEQLPAEDAIERHPELRPLFGALKAFREGLAERFPDDSYSRDRYLAKARADILDKLNSGAVPRTLEAVRLDQNGGGKSPPLPSELDRK
jgi:hypothetical protein